MIRAQKNSIINKIFTVYHSNLLKKHFCSINISGEENISKANRELPTILYANHSNWWDGFIAYRLTNNRWKTDDYLMMDIEQMKKYSFFKYVGVFSVDRNDPKSAIESINYASDLLKSTKRFLWIFPQGLMQVQDFRPLKFYSGITKITEKLGNVNLLPVAIRYEFIMEQRPEVFIKIGDPDIVNGQLTDSKEFTNYLQQKLTGELDYLKQAVINQKPDEFKIIFKGKSSRNKTIDKLHGE